MKCEKAQDNIVLATYGELPDDQAAWLEQHLADCAACHEQLTRLLAMHEQLGLLPVEEPTPNLLAQSRMRLDEALDMIPPHGFIAQLRSNLFGWLGHMQSAPALMTLLVGSGFLAGNFTYRYQVAHEHKVPATVILGGANNGTIANVSGIVQTPNSEIVQVNYNRLVPETVQGSLHSPEILQLLTLGMKAGQTNEVRQDSVAMLANECLVGHACAGESGSSGVRNALMVTLHFDKNPSVRLKALEGLKPYVAQDERVRDAVAQALMHDTSAPVRTKAIDMLQPVESDSSVRQVFRTVSTTDENPYIRTVSTHALEGTSAIQ